MQRQTSIPTSDVEIIPHEKPVSAFNHCALELELHRIASLLKHPSLKDSWYFGAESTLVGSHE